MHYFMGILLCTYSCAFVCVRILVTMCVFTGHMCVFVRIFVVVCVFLGYVCTYRLYGHVRFLDFFEAVYVFEAMCV